MNRDTSLILALDVNSRDRALILAEQLKDYFDAIKIGYPLILPAGLKIVKEISVIAPVIADLKVADIPNTNRLICEAVLEAGASGIIAQAFPGKDSLIACADCAASYGADLYAVTEMSHPGAEQFMAPQAESMARMAVEAGASGVGPGHTPGENQAHPLHHREQDHHFTGSGSPGRLSPTGSAGRS